jgi:2-amino-4-hydroxy-6-hydroxymethyldihydropteridine diphosphokinase
MNTVYLSLGANLGDRRANLEKAICGLSTLGTVRRVSSFYETEPVEVEGQQPWFLNCAVEMETECPAEDLVRRILALERDMGRERREPKGPRTVDIDILLFNQEVIISPDLRIPHPSMHQRAFVLAPLAEIAPGALHPVLRRTAQQLWESLPSDGAIVRKLA